MSHAIRIGTLASGSSGNAVYAECPAGALLVDSGLSGKRVAEGLARIGGRFERIQAILITHDHDDHVRGAGVLHRRHGIPLYMSAGTRDAAADRLGPVNGIRTFRPGASLQLAGFTIQTLPTPHDGAEPAALVLEHGGVRCGVLTDLGHAFPALQEVLGSLHLAILESNHDPEMLARGPYPAWLQRRIRSDHGHLSNAEAAHLVRDHAGPDLRALLLAHLSAENNEPACALRTVQRLAADRIQANSLAIHVAPRNEPSPLFSL